MLRRFGLMAAVMAGLVAACGQPAGAPEPAATPAVTGGPALWRTSDADTTIYLFGTVHVLPPDLAWRTPAIDAALAESKAVYFETDINPDISQIQSLVASLGLYPPPDKLSNHLSAEDFATLTRVSNDLSLPIFMIDAMKPWFAAMTLAEQLITKAGFDPMSGVERTLGPEASEAGKDIRMLETIEFQLRVFADLPQDVQIRYLMDGVSQFEEEMQLLDDLVAAWARGDVDMLDQIMIEDELADMPEIYDALLVNRNRNWTQALAELKASETGVFFVAVGAAHLAGKDSVQLMLEAEGHTVERVN